MIRVEFNLRKHTVICNTITKRIQTECITSKLVERKKQNEEKMEGEKKIKEDNTRDKRDRRDGTT